MSWMPFYNNLKDWKKLDILDIKVLPKEKWRRIPLLKQFIPYFAYQKVKLQLELVKRNGFKEEKLNQVKLFEHLPGSEPYESNTSVHSLKENQSVPNYESVNPLTGSGEVKLTIGTSTPNHRDDTLFSARVINPEYFVPELVIGTILILIGFFLGKCSR